MHVSDIVKQDESDALTTVIDVHCRERGIDPSGKAAGQVAGVVEALVDSGTVKPDDIRAALISRSEKDGTTTLDGPQEPV